MVIQDNFQCAQQFSVQVHQFLENHRVPATPINYSVIYLYVSDQHLPLKQTIKTALTSNTPIDSVFLESLFDKYLSNTQQIEQSVIEPFEETISRTLASITQQVSHEKETANNLLKVDKVLAKMSEHKQLNSVVNYIIDSVNSSQDQRRVLSDELEKTYAEVNLLKNQLEESRQEAIVDSLTGLLNRRGCDSKLEAFDLSIVHSSLAIDIDHFKKINDTFGHFIGDSVIKRIAQVIKSNVASEDLAVRFGGEEFVVVMRNKSIAVAKHTAEAIRKAVESMKLVQKQSNTALPPISVSIGVAERVNDESWQDLFSRADAALYQAKNGGRNCCVMANLQ